MSDARHPLCRMTRATAPSHAVFRVLDTGELSRRQRAHLSLHAANDPLQEAVRELRSARPDVHIDLLHQTAGHASLQLETPMDAPLSGLSAIAPVLSQHGLHPILAPIIVKDGKAKARVVFPRQAEAQEVLRAFQEVERAAGFGEFRIQRIGALAPAGHLDCTRRALPAEQEALLSLAAGMGYYETPKLVTLEEIARAVGLSISPVHKRLKAAEEAIVGQHVVPGIMDAQRRRARASPGRIEASSPWEVQIRARGDLGPLAALAQFPEARAAIHIVSAEGSRSQIYLLVLLANLDVQEKVLAAIQDRPEITSSLVIERMSTHVVCRLTAHERGPYSLAWWGDAWGQDGVLRSIVFEGGDAYLRGLLARPLTNERFQQRVADCARAAGWTDWEIVAMRDLCEGGAPPHWPEPLTQRQLEVLRVAHALGYYKTPRGCTLEHVANTLGVSANAVHKNLVLAESKLISGYLAAGV